MGKQSAYLVTPHAALRSILPPFLPPRLVGADPVSVISLHPASRPGVVDVDDTAAEAP